MENKEKKEIEKLLEIGVHFGHTTPFHHPSMEKFIYGKRSNIEIIDVIKTLEKLNEALEFLKKKKKENPLIFFVGTKPIAKNFIEKMSKELNFPYVSEKWLGGTLTNFETISRKLKKFKELLEKKEKGGFEKLIKKVRVKIEREIEKERKYLEPLLLLKKLPDILFVVDAKKEETALIEAKKMRITTMGICDTDGNADLLDFPIPANDDNKESLKFILEKVKNVLKKEK